MNHQPFSPAISTIDKLQTTKRFWRHAQAIAHHPARVPSADLSSYNTGGREEALTGTPCDNDSELNSGNQRAPVNDLDLHGAV